MRNLLKFKSIDMKSVCACVFVLSLQLFVCGQSTSPCPGIFEYESDETDREVFGIITLKKDSDQPVNSLELVVTLVLPDYYIIAGEGHDGYLESLPTSPLLKLYNQREPITYRLHHPVTYPLPKVIEVMFNGRIICQGPPVPSSLKRVTLRSTAAPVPLQIDFDNAVPSRPENEFAVTWPTSAATTRPTSRPVVATSPTPRPVVATRPTPRPEVTTRLTPRPEVTTRPTPRSEVTTRPTLRPEVTTRPTLRPEVTTRPTPRPVVASRPTPRPEVTTRSTSKPVVTIRPTLRPIATVKLTPRPVVTTTSTPRFVITARPDDRFTNTLNTKEECGVVGDGSNEWVPSMNNAKFYERGELPWLVAIYRTVNNNLFFICGGTLVSDRHIVTAAHCMRRRDLAVPMSEIVVKVGVYSLNDWSDDLTVTTKLIAATIHEEYNPNTLQNDILILTLIKRIKFNRYSRPACLWNEVIDLSYVVGASGIVAGWGGRAEWDLDKRDHPQMVRVPIVSSEECRTSNAVFQNRTFDNTLCAGDRNTAGLCTGDSGGGLYLLVGGKWKLRGVVSAPLRSENTYALCNLNEYVLFIDTAQFLPWIRNILSERYYD